MRSPFNSGRGDSEMLRAVVVDDDKIIRRSIVRTADWNETGFVCCAEAYDGQDAIEKMGSMYPNLIITDICMPRMDGIELMRMMKTRSPRTKFIVLSNYDDFKYVKGAMQIGALDYILKYGITKEIINRQLFRAREIIEAEENTQRQLIMFENEHAAERKSRFWESLFHVEMRDSDIMNEANRLGIGLTPLKGAFLMIAGGEGCAGDTIKQVSLGLITMLKSKYPGAEFHEFVDDKRNQCIFMNLKEPNGGTNDSNRLEDCVRLFLKRENYDGEHFIVSISDIFRDTACMFKDSVKCRHMLETLYYDSTSRIVTEKTFKPFRGTYNPSTAEKIIDDIIRGLILKNLAEAFGAVDALIHEINDIRTEPAMNGMIFHSLIFRLNKVCLVENGSSQESCGKYSNGMMPLDLFDTRRELESVRIGIRSILSEIDRRLYYICDSVKNEAIDRAVNFIIRNQQNPIGLEKVADHVGLSKNHFCRLFKQETGQNFLHFLNRIRIERAKQLLINSDLSVLNISEATGFSDYRYFDKIFTKYEGLIPSDFRKNKNLLNG
jgi:two-component system, response regulator YesN